MSKPEELLAKHAVVGGLAEVLHELGAELKRAHDIAPEEATIAFNGADVELSVVVSGDGKAGFKFWVIDAEVGASYERAAKITVSLVPTVPAYELGGGEERDRWNLRDALRRFRARVLGRDG